MQNAQGKPTNKDTADLIKYIAPAHCELLRNNKNDKRPSNLYQMALGLLEAKKNPTHCTQATGNVAQS